MFGLVMTNPLQVGECWLEEQPVAGRGRAGRVNIGALTYSLLLYGSSRGSDCPGALFLIRIFVFFSTQQLVASKGLVTAGVTLHLVRGLSSTEVRN